MVSLDSPVTVVRPHLIEFGVGTSGKLGAWAASKGYLRTLIISDAFNAARIDMLQLNGEVSVFSDVTPEPDIANLDKVLAAAEATQAELIVGFGGGSAMPATRNQPGYHTIRGSSFERSYCHAELISISRS